MSTLEQAITLFTTYEKKHVIDMVVKKEELVLALRDSMIKRFSYSTDLFLKALKVYLEEVELIDLFMVSQHTLIRDSVKAKVLSEQEGKMCVEMVNNRNKTSHIYHQEIAQVIASNIPQFYRLMEDIVARLENNMMV